MGERPALVSGPQAGRGRELALLLPETGALIALPEVDPGPAGTEIQGALMLGDEFWLSAFRPDVGQELFRHDLSPWLSLLFADGFEAGNLEGWSSTTP